MYISDQTTKYSQIQMPEYKLTRIWWWSPCKNSVYDININYNLL